MSLTVDSKCEVSAGVGDGQHVEQQQNGDAQELVHFAPASPTKTNTDGSRYEFSFCVLLGRHDGRRLRLLANASRVKFTAVTLKKHFGLPARVRPIFRGVTVSRNARRGDTDENSKS